MQSTRTKEMKIPETLEECYSVLESELPQEEREKLKAMSSDSLYQLHFGLGRTIRNEFGLWGEGPLYDWFDAQGVDQPDQISEYILNGFWLYLNGLPSGFDEAREISDRKKRAVIEAELRKTFPDRYT